MALTMPMHQLVSPRDAPPGPELPHPRNQRTRSRKFRSATAATLLEEPAAIVCKQAGSRDPLRPSTSHASEGVLSSPRAPPIFLHPPVSSSSRRTRSAPGNFSKPETAARHRTSSPDKPRPSVHRKCPAVAANKQRYQLAPVWNPCIRKTDLVCIRPAPFRREYRTSLVGARAGRRSAQRDPLSNA